MLVNLSKRFSIFDLTLIVVAIAAFCFLAWPLRVWLIDDAGISLAYARNIAEGYGMVHQQGAQPVEGISNPLWTFLFVPFFVVGFFDPLIVTKGVSILLILLSFFLTLKISNHFTEHTYWAAAVVVLGFACSTPVIIWGLSGLENPLYLAYVLALLLVSLRFAQIKETNRTNYGLLAGLLSASIALTRPEGVLLFTIFPIAILGWWLLERIITWKDVVRVVGAFTASFTAVFGGYLLFRVLYFGDWYPNTYYVKGGPDSEKALLALTLRGEYLKKFQEFSATFFGSKGWILLPVCIVVLFTLSFLNKKRRTDILVLLLTFFITCYTYLLMTQDWMGEYRFGTAVYPMAYLCIGVLLYQMLLHLVNASKLRSIIGWCVAGLVLVAVWKENSTRLNTFCAQPPTSYFTVVERFAKPFNEYADAFELDSASLLLPDIGGTLMHSKLKVYDLGGLCDKTIATTRGRDQSHFHNYIFDTLKPTFIHTHGYFTAVSTFDDDPRFKRDYEPIEQSIDAYVQRAYKATRVSGDFVRKEAIVGKEAVLDSLRTQLNK